MATYRIYIEEVSTRLLAKDVDATTPEHAAALAQAALDDGSWSEWAEQESDCTLDVRDDLHERVGRADHAYRPDHNGECLDCDEPADAHSDGWEP